MGIRDSRGREGGSVVSCSSHLQRRAGRRCKEQRSFASLWSHREGQCAVCVSGSGRRLARMAGSPQPSAAFPVPGVWEVLQPHVQPAGPYAPARRQQAIQVPLLLQQVQPQGKPEPAHEGQAWRHGHQPGQPRWVGCAQWTEQE